MQKTQSLRPSPDALLNPRCDPIFKAIFTQNTEESNLALKDFISAVLDRDVCDLALQPNEMPVDMLAETQMSFDVSVTFDDGERADIEIQGRHYDYDYGSRAEIQAARMLNVSAQKGGEWSAPRCYQISVLNFEYDKGDKPPLAWYTMRKTDGGKLADRLNVIFLDLVKIRRLTDKNAESLTKLEKWGMFFAYADDAGRQDYIAQIARGEKGIMAADFIVKTMSADEASWWRQNSYWIAERDRNTERANAIRRGLAEGRKKGLAEGERNARLEMARRMLQNGKLSLTEIADISGLSLKEVESLN